MTGVIEVKPPSAPKAPASAGRRSNLVVRLARSTTGGYAIALAAIFVVWWLGVLVFQPAEYLIPSPGDTMAVTREHWDVLLEHTLVTLRETLVGFGLALAFGVPIGMLISFFATVEKLAFPVLIISQAVPKVALAPILVIWFGFGWLTNALIATLVAVFPIIINTQLGMSSVSRDMVRLGRVMGGGSVRVMRKIRVPVALPSLFAGMKLAITLALIGAVVGEFVAASQGLGYLAQQASGTLDTPLTFACLVLLSLLGIGLFVAIEACEWLSQKLFP